MNKLTEAEYAAVVAAIQRKPHEARLFKSGVRKMNIGERVMCAPPKTILAKAGAMLGKVTPLSEA